MIERKTIRAESYDAYKANREKAPDELNIQFGLIRDILNDMGIKFFDMIGYEADDIIGSISKKFQIRVMRLLFLLVIRTIFNL